jgi:signal transduction histidine kinase
MSQFPREEKKEDSVKLLKDAIEVKINELAELNQRLKKKLFDLGTVLELSRQFNSVLYLDSILENTLLTCLEHLSVKGAFIAVQSHLQDKSFSLSKTRGIEMQKELELSPDSDWAKYLKDKNKPLFFDELLKGFKSVQRKRKPALEPQPEIIAPIKAKSSLRGVLLLSDKITGKLCSGDELELIAILCHQVAMSVENLLLHQAEEGINKELRKTRQRLTQTEKLATMGQLSVTLAHEVNNALGIIKNYLTLLSQPPGKKDRTTSYLKMAGEEVDRVARIFGQFLNFYPHPSEAKSLIDIGFLLQDTFTLVGKRLENEGIRIKKKIHSSLPKVEVFPNELRQVFINLLMSSRNSMPKGGEIEVSAGVEEGRLKIEFKDTGRAIDKKELSRIFDPFYSTRDNASGLNLWVSNDIMKRHEGEIEVKNREDREGICFSLSLPFSV